MADRGAACRKVSFPSLCGLIFHPTHGWILYDTGYSQHFHDATQLFPELLYRKTLPIALPHHEELLVQMHTRGITPADIRIIIISHYHGDHVSGLRDFPQARFIALKADTHHMLSLIGHRFKATAQGCLPGLVPSNFVSRLSYADDQPLITLPLFMAEFQYGFDLLGDGSLIGIPLSGHSSGQLGVWIPYVQNKKPAFLVADACWSEPACKEGRLPSRATLFINANKQQFHDTFFKLHHLINQEPSLAIIPSHCTTSWHNYA